MQTFKILLLFLMLTLLVFAEPERMVTLRETAILVSSDESLSTSDKDSLSSSLLGDISKGLLLLKSDTEVEVLCRSRFMLQQVVYDRENSTSSTLNRLVKVAQVRVLNGEHKGDSGWLVVSFRDTGRDPQVYLSDISSSSVEK